MNPNDPLAPDDRENLVAYLDGELDETSARAMETRLDQSPEIRKEADAMQMAWDLLDYLPRPEPAETFSQHTVARLELEKSREFVRRRRQRWLGYAGLGFGTAAAALLGFFLSYERPPTVEEMRIVQYRDIYEHIDNLEFLQELAAADLFGDDL